MKRLTKIPTENAPNAPIIESYEEDDKVILGIKEEFTVPDRWRRKATVIASR